jgi:TonB family protein
MARRSFSSSAGPALVTLVASMLLHVLMWPVGNKLLELDWMNQPIALAGGVMEVALLAPEDEAEDLANRADDQEKAVQPDERTPDGQLVDLDRLVRETPPENARFVSEFDHTVEKETRAPPRPHRPGALQAPSGDAPDAVESPSPPRPSPRPPDEVQALSLGERTGAADSGQGREADPWPVDPAEEGALPVDPGRAGSVGRSGIRGLPDVARREFGSPGSYDSLEDIEDGSENVLNSRRWKFASFFNRVRDAVAQHWHPEVLHAARDPYGKVYGTKTRITRLWIRLNADGSLARIRVDQPCGVDFLDEEAIRAVRTAQPFSNPPPQLVDPATGSIEFGFRFIFEIGGRTQIFRYRR